MSKFLGLPTTLGSGSGFLGISGSSPIPSISTVSPPFGSVSGSTPITLTGSNFTGTTTVSIGGTNITSLAVVNDNTITGTTAAGSVANANVVVSAPGGSGTLSQGFTYLPTNWTTGLFGDLGVSASLGKVSTWSDRSGSGNDFAQSNNSNKPIWTAPSGSNRGFLTFDGSATQLIGTNSFQRVFASDLTAFSLYAVAWQTTAGSATDPEALNGSMLADFDPTLGGNYGYYCLGGAASDLFGSTNTWAANIYDALADSTVIAGNSSLDYTHVQLIARSLDGTVGGGTQYISINSGDTFSDSNINNGSINAGAVLNTLQLGQSGYGGATFYTGNVYAVFIWNRRLTTDENGVVRTMFKNLYSIPNW